jgi:EpsI family protein
MVVRSLILFVVLTVGAVAIARAERTEPVPMRASFNTFPMQIGAWKGVQEPPFEPKILAILGVDDYLTRAYFAPDRTGAGLYIGYWQTQRQGDTIHSPLNCLPGAGWEPLSKRPTEISVPAGESNAPRQIEINRYIVQKGLERQLILYWYQSHGRVVASEYWSKFYLVTDAVRFNRTDAALVRVMVPVVLSRDSLNADEGERQAERAATKFVQALFPVLSNYLPQ